MSGRVARRASSAGRCWCCSRAVLPGYPAALLTSRVRYSAPAAHHPEAWSPTRSCCEPPLREADRLPVDAKPYEWRLILPRAFMNMEIGINGDTYRADNTKNNSWFDTKGTRKGDDFFVYLNSTVDLAASEISPAVFAKGDIFKNRFVAIVLSNRSTFSTCNQ